MRSFRIPAMLVLGLSVLWAMGSSIDVAADHDGVDIAIKDNCDPDDPGWAPTGGCLLKRGDVTLAEFQTFLRSPLYDQPFNSADNPVGQFLVGHPSWRNDPSHVVVEQGERIRVKNEGGRLHTFTPVAEFGGGRVPPLLVGTTMAPECAAPAAPPTDPYQVAPGDKLKLKATTEGIQRFQCCIHPWMRATVRVVPEHDH
jgi:plastocyanin